VTASAALGRPPDPLVDVDREHGSGRGHGPVLLVLLAQQRYGAVGLVAVVEDARSAADTDPPQPPPILVVAIDEDGDMRVRSGVLDAAKGARALPLRVDGRVEGLAVEREHDRNEMWPSVGIDGGESRDPRVGHLASQYARIVHLGVILPNFGADSSPDAIRRSGEAAEELGFDSVWVTEHIIVGPEAINPYGRVYDPLVTLGWIAGWTERVALGTSIVLVPLHHPIHLAKETATLQELSGGRLVLGVGVGWHEDEFRTMNVPFAGRGRRADESIRLMKALWCGESSSHGESWPFENATFAPLPRPVPEIWVGGSSGPAIRRARKLGDAWHPSRRSDSAHVRQVKQRHPELRVVPRTRVELVDGFLDAGAEGVVVTLADRRAMRDFLRRYR
jgi:probable F420-dependent oxidoreductase